MIAFVATVAVTAWCSSAADCPTMRKLSPAFWNGVSSCGQCSGLATLSSKRYTKCLRAHQSCPDSLGKVRHARSFQSLNYNARGADIVRTADYHKPNRGLRFESCPCYSSAKAKPWVRKLSDSPGRWEGRHREVWPGEAESRYMLPPMSDDNLATNTDQWLKITVWHEYCQCLLGELVQFTLILHGNMGCGRRAVKHYIKLS